MYRERKFRYTQFAVRTCHGRIVEIEMTDAIGLAIARRLCRNGQARELRVRADLSQGDVGASVGATHAAVSRWERGQRRPTGDAGARYGELLAALAGGAADV
jgi:DNA-binding transcriptional regulator YiaG